MKMARVIQAGLVAMVLAIGVFPQGPWKRHSSLDKRYTFEMPPGEPTRGGRRLEDENGNLVELRSTAINDGVVRYIVSHYDVPESTKFSFSRSRDGIVKRLNGKLVSENSAIIAGMQTRTFRVHLKSVNGHDVVVTVRLISGKSRVYLMQAIFPRSLENTSAEGNARWFFNSFALNE